ncbi:MAG: adhesin [Lachnospiraceae bacterium]|nr:adhesin [Lachnospiraceae bacterium]
MRRKYIALALGITFCFVVGATGCGSSSTASSASTTAATEASTEAVASAESSSTEATEAAPGGASEGDKSGAPDGNKEGGPGEGQGGPGGNDGNQPPSMPDGGGQGFGGGADTMTFDYDGTYSGALVADGEEVDSDGETVEATEADQNGLLAENAGTLTVANAKVSKSGDDTNGDRCNFYGCNSIALSIGENSLLKLSDSTLEASSEGSNAIFATDSGTVYAKGTTINTTAGNSRGLDATYNGTIIADDMDITTKGDHCASIATDRGGGNISATNSSLNTSGSGSPILYSTGDIEVDNVTGTASGSQIAGMEGLNTIIIHNSDLTSEITKATASDPVANGIILYQSTSGDAEASTGDTATFQAVDSTLTSKIESGSMFYVTNTNVNVLLSGTTLNYDSDKANLLQIEGNDSNNWGTAGSNGGTVTFTALGETLEGDISVDTISSLDFFLLDGSNYTGAMKITENSVNTSATDAPITVNISADSKWVVTEDTTISALNAEDGAEIVDESGKTVTIVANGKTVVEGDSDITVTVEGDYSTTVTTGETNEISSDYIDRSDFDSYFGTSTSFS